MEKMIKKIVKEALLEAIESKKYSQYDEKEEFKLTKGTEKYPYILSIEETAKIFGIGANTLRELIRTDEDIPILKVGAHIKINSGLFKEYLDKATREGRNLKE